MFLVERRGDAVRVLLTGQASMENAVAVVNAGNIFRFLTARQILRSAAGEVMVSTASEQGATFTVVLPLADDSGVLATAAASVPRQARLA